MFGILANVPYTDLTWKIEGFSSAEDAWAYADGPLTDDEGPVIFPLNTLFEIYEVEEK